MTRDHALLPIISVLLLLLHPSLLLSSALTQFQVTGILVDADQAPVSGVSVLLLNDQSEQIASDQSDSQGRFTLAYQVTSADPGDGADLPAEFKLGASYPNPFNPRTTVPFHAPENTRATITVYNILGQEILRTGADISAGSHKIQVNLGGRLSQGQYILSVQGDGFSLTRPMTFVSAGIGGGNPEITVRQGGQASGRISGNISNSIRLTDDEMEFRIVVEGTDRFQGKEVTVAAFENRDVGSLELVHRQTDDSPWPRDTETEVVEITNPLTGRIWMDRNLGATRLATSTSDELAYGDLYQWGRAADGHQKRNSPSYNFTFVSPVDQPGHGFFIEGHHSSRMDWRSPRNDSLWQGVDGINNPCPPGFRLPTEAEWNNERISWTSNNENGELGSPLKLPLTGLRIGSNSSLTHEGIVGYYWSSTVSDANAIILTVRSRPIATGDIGRSYGAVVRCTKNYDPVTYALTLVVFPEASGTARGGTQYVEGAEVTITAGAIAGFTFVRWSGDTANVADENAPSTTVTMPSRDVHLTAIFEGISVTEVVEVTNPGTGRVWMDRNLGASRAGTEIRDIQAYGDLYQWGRAADGHQKRNSLTTSTLSSSDDPGHGSFILVEYRPRDWRSPENDSLWQGVDGINNPCPSGFRLPTEAEWEAERQSWVSDDAESAFSSPLKLTMAGGRSQSSGGEVGFGNYWSSSVSDTYARFLRIQVSSVFSDGFARMGDGDRAQGYSVRCIKD